MAARELFFAGSLVVFTAIAVYFLKKSDSERDEYMQETTSRQTVIELRIPRTAIGYVIGREGSNIREIQQITNTRINFKDPVSGSDDRVCLIRGKAEFAQEAERLIQKAITDRPSVTTVTISVPQQACGRIIGRNGDSIRELCAQSHAKILVDRSFKSSPDGMRVVTISGTEQQISLAKDLIKDKVQEEATMRRKIELSTANRLPRNRNNKQSNPQDEQSVDTVRSAVVSTRETLLSTAADGYMEVFVSAVDTPAHFWLQVKSPRSVELDKLVERMTAHYSDVERRALSALQQVSVGELVAAPFPHDSSWYRAEVLEAPADGSISVYYVDFGDTSELPVDQLADLRSEFLSLSHQAIECRLADVRPAGCEWSEAAADCFESLTYAAQWKSIMAKVVRYQPSGGSRLPVVQLVDTNSAVDVNVAKELVKRGLAVWQSGGGDQQKSCPPREQSPCPPSAAAAVPSPAEPAAACSHSRG